MTRARFVGGDRPMRLQVNASLRFLRWLRARAVPVPLRPRQSRNNAQRTLLLAAKDDAVSAQGNRYGPSVLPTNGFGHKFPKLHAFIAQENWQFGDVASTKNTRHWRLRGLSCPTLAPEGLRRLDDLSDPRVSTSTVQWMVFTDSVRTIPGVAGAKDAGGAREENRLTFQERNASTKSRRATHSTSMRKGKELSLLAARVRTEADEKPQSRTVCGQ